MVVGTAASKAKATVTPSKPVHKQKSPPPDTKVVSTDLQPSDVIIHWTNVVARKRESLRASSPQGLPISWRLLPMLHPKGPGRDQSQMTRKKVLSIPFVAYIVQSKSRSPSPKREPRISVKRQKELDELNKMMEDDESEGVHCPEVHAYLELEDFPPEAAVEESATPMLVDSQPQEAVEPADEEPKRKRRKRKVLRKTTKRDEKGYLGIVMLRSILMVVTKNEYVYESFSEEEDEAEVQKEKKVIHQGPTTHVAERKKGKGSAAVQKSLMSFFGNK